MKKHFNPAFLFISAIYYLLLSITPFLQGHAEVQAPNYSFNLSELDSFLPSKKYQEIEEKYGKGQILTEKGQLKTVKYTIAKNTYSYHILLQIIDQDVVETYVKFPSYFLHDVILESLIKSYGKQERYLKINEEAIYKWNDSKGFIIHYFATCAITCYPVYLSLIGKDLSESHKGKFTPLQEAMTKRIEQ